MRLRMTARLAHRFGTKAPIHASGEPDNNPILDWCTAKCAVLVSGSFASTARYCSLVLSRRTC